MLAPTFVLTVALAQASAPLPGLDIAPGDVRVWQLNDIMRARRDAARQTTSSPGSVAAFRALLQLGREDDALDALMLLVDDRPRELADALPALTSGAHFSDGARDYAPRLRAIFAAAHEKAAQLPREDAAALELAVIGAESLIEHGSEAWRTRATAFVQRYDGTHAAAMTQIQLVTFNSMSQRLDALDAIARAYPGTDIAAAAIYQKGFDLAHNAFVTGPDRQPDPTDRFQRVLAIVDELESGKYPKGEWVEKAPMLVVEFNTYKPEYTPEHLDVMLAGYRAVVKRHFTVDALYPLSNRYGYVITSKMAELYKMKGDADGVDRTLRELEAESADRQWAGYLRALRTPRGAARVEMLDAIASNAQNPYAAKALATLALDELQAGDPAAARDRFRRFVARYPRSDYAWIAALHAVEADAKLGDWKTAEQAFAAVAQTYSAAPAAVVLGRALAAHSAQAGGQLARAAEHFTAALAAWDRETFEVSLYTTRESPAFRREETARRTDTLRALLAQPGGEIVERGRWQLTNGDRPGAIASFDTALSRFPSSPVVPQARLLLHRAQMEAALDLGNIERPDADPKAAESRLEALAREPADSAVIAARIARASMQWTAGDKDGARTAMGSALGDWIKAQPHAEPQSDLERDAAAIRDVVFLPLGGGILGNRGWNAFKWPDALPPFLLIDPAINVKLPSGDLTTMTVTKTLPGYANVVFADETMQGLLERTMIALGGTKRRVPTGIMETPNQPAGESMNILALWNAFFPTRPGHWGGWEFTSYPRLTRIEFLDAARTRAAANVTIGYSGVTIVLEKRGTAWMPVRLTNEWIT